MSPEAEALFCEAAELPPRDRAAFVEARCADPAERAEILSLLAHDGLAGPLFEPAIEASVAGLAGDPEPGEGDRVGAYELAGVLGRGGMGTVYKALRADGAFHQTAAVKFPAFDRGLWTGERFLEERRILGRLVHPNIARLLDAGETASGRPYLVLEYVDGLPADQHCKQERLASRAILTLFLGVLEGVAHAHRNLVIHRDLKPGNILVDRAGVARVLDFGIAKVIEAGTDAATGTTRLLTPEYASPEQISGDPVTTASDVFSLGAVLHGLLAGKPARDLTGVSPLEAMERLARTEVRVAANLPSELVSILSKSMRLDPAERYPSASEFRADIQRYLDGLPVEAAPDTRFYAARKLMWRHRGAIAIACAVIAAIATSAAVAVVQARRAERRAAEVRQLASRFLFEFEESIRALPGATRPRQLVVQTASDYLARLAAEAGGDRELTRELADSYRKLGEVQGSLAVASAADSKMGLESYRKALQLMDSIGLGDARDEAALFRYLDCLYDLMVLEQAAGDPGRRIGLLNRAVTIADSWLETAGSADLLGAIAAVYGQQSGQAAEEARMSDAVATARKSLRARKRAAAARPDDRKTRRGVAVGHWAVAAALSQAGDRGPAVAEWRAAVQVYEKLVQEDPGNASFARELLTATYQHGVDLKRDLLARKQDLGPALAFLNAARERANALVAADPGNGVLRMDQASIHLAYGAALVQGKRYAPAFEVLREAIDRAEQLVRDGRGGRNTQVTLALAIGWLAQAHFESGAAAMALNLYLRQGGIFDRLAQADPKSQSYRREQAGNLLHVGMARARLGESRLAHEAYERGIAIARALPGGKAAAETDEIIRLLETELAALRTR